MPIPLETLRAVHRVIVHANCPDGRASALILHAALPKAEIAEMSYGDPAHEALQPEPGLLFCDFTPPKDRLAEFAAAGAIVLDHHDVDLSAFGALGVKGDNSKAESGAALAFREVAVPMLQLEGRLGSHGQAMRNCLLSTATVAAIRDTWQRDSPHWDAACSFSEALRFVPLADLLEMGVVEFSFLAKKLGPMLRRKALACAQDAARGAVRWTIAGRRVAVLSTVRGVDDAADVLDAEVDLVVAFDYVQEPGRVRLKVSLRSTGAVNCTALAKAHGGGGHESGHTAGFHLPVDVDALESRAPYVTLRALLEAAL